MIDREPGSLTLTWKNVTAWTKNIRKSDSRKRLLSDVSGIAKSGVLTAVLSPSGAGKTTLLAILSKRFKGSVTGEVLVNGCELSEEKVSRISGYVCQKEQNHEHLTVYEHLTFMARLKMDKDTTEECCHENVVKVTRSLLLSDKLHVTIHSLSGGQKKRLTLAVQLLTEPKILFCDEPTTGLDSYSAEQVVRLLRAIANDGKMVLCSIHQPASGIFELFDDVTLLASGGKLAFHGPVSSIGSYLSGLGASCPENFNMSEFIVSQVTIKFSAEGKIEDEEINVQKIVDAFIWSEIYENLMVQIHNVRNETAVVKSQIQTSKREAVSFTTELGYLFWRTVSLQKHSYQTTLMCLYVNAAICFGMGLLFHGTFGGGQKGVQSTLGFLYSYTIQISYAPLYYVLQHLPEEIPICVSEIADRVYSPASLYISTSVFLTGLMAVQTIILMALLFWASNLQETISDFIAIAFFSLLLSSASCSYGIFLSTAFRSIETNALFSIPFEFIQRLFCGIQVRIDSLPWYLAILKYISFPFYSFEALNIIQWSKTQHIGCELNSDVPCYRSGDQVLTSLGFGGDSLLMDVVGLVFCTLFWHILGFVFLTRKLKLFAAY